MCVVNITVHLRQIITGCYIFSMKQSDVHITPRLYVSEADLSQGVSYVLSDDQAHYLRSVLRKNVGDSVRVFNGRDGEWLATLSHIDKKSVEVKVENLTRRQEPARSISLAISPIKKERCEWLVEKCSEIGLEKISLVNMDRTQRAHVNLNRLETIAIESAEQSERLDIIKIYEINNLKLYIDQLCSDEKLLVCLERAEAPAMGEYQSDLAKVTSVSVLVGPEGGISPAEKELLLSHPSVLPVSLGSQILRSETAALVACAQLMALRK